MIGDFVVSFGSFHSLPFTGVSVPDLPRKTSELVWGNSSLNGMMTRLLS